MKRFLSLTLCFFLLVGIFTSAEEADTNVLLKIWNASDLKFSYLRLDFYSEDKPISYIVSYPDEGEYFYRCPVKAGNQEELDKLRIEYSYGVSDLSPEEAALQAIAGNPAEEHPLQAPSLKLECGETYSVMLVQEDVDRYKLTPMENTWNDWSTPLDPGEPTPIDAINETLIEFFTSWAKKEYDIMLNLCTADWKAETENPSEFLLSIAETWQPQSITSEAISGTDEDTVRTMTLRLSARKEDSGLFENYYLHVILQKEEDEIWRIDPRSLADFELIPEE